LIKSIIGTKKALMTDNATDQASLATLTERRLSRADVAGNIQ
jgi:hypothetical protein